VLIDFGHAKLIKDQPTGNITRLIVPREEPSVPAKESGETTFLREQTRALGTLGYNAPESKKDRTYDSEKADVFAAGIVIFLCRQPSPPFRNNDHSALNDEDSSSFWRRWPNFKGLDESKLMLDCLLKLDPTKRPTFKQLKAAISGDADVLKEFPGLAWLSGPVSGPLQFVRELRQRHQRVCLKCEGVVEALALFVRGHGCASKAFAAANTSGNGRLTPDEFVNVVAESDSTITPEGVAELMRRYVNPTADDMTLDEFEKMSHDWEFGGRPIVYEAGVMMLRRFAFKPLNEITDASKSLEELDRFVADVRNALAVSYDVREDHLEEIDPTASPKEARTMTPSIHSFIVGMPSNSSCGDWCQLHINALACAGRLIIETRRTWGSAVEEMSMLQMMNDALIETYGARVEVPAELEEARDRMLHGDAT
jgi:hypothetical protein